VSRETHHKASPGANDPLLSPILRESEAFQRSVQAALHPAVPWHQEAKHPAQRQPPAREHRGPGRTLADGFAQETAVKRTPAQILLGIHLKEMEFGRSIVYEYQFNPGRKWRADLAIPELRLLFECDGGAYRGGHKRGKALGEDYEKQNWAQLAGYRILRFTNEQVLNGKAKAFLQEWMAKEVTEETLGDA
jgi:very-short-patch-repair endonuclease